MTKKRTGHIPPKLERVTLTVYVNGVKTTRAALGLPCPCGSHGTPVTGADIYPHRPDLHRKLFYKCDSCGRYVGCHRSGEPFGHLANAETRAARGRAHKAFDAIWQGGLCSRGRLYARMKREIGIHHIAWCTADECETVINWSLNYVSSKR